MSFGLNMTRTTDVVLLFVRVSATGLETSDFASCTFTSQGSTTIHDTKYLAWAVGGLNSTACERANQM